MSPGCGVGSSRYLTQTSHIDCDCLCWLDVLGLEDHPDGDQEVPYEEFKEQLHHDSAGWYETDLLWKSEHPPLQHNREMSIACSSELLRKLNKT